ncbi:hypothetical protein ACL07V_37235 [Streptomyces sp. MB22_4]|uniref:hypothetical protein n=1 Tax=Streptomyces sp. MB22_4 TaxID=3383120 RepID=UPI0039A0E2F2
MTDYFCVACAEELFGPEALAHVQRVVDAAPPLSPEQRVRLRALFHVSLVQRRLMKVPKKECGH